MGLDGEEEMSDKGDRMIEEFISQEELEFEAIMSSMGGPSSEHVNPTVEREMSGYSSEDEEYDALMMQALLQAEGCKDNPNTSLSDDDGNMDMSMG